MDSILGNLGIVLQCTEVEMSRCGQGKEILCAGLHVTKVAETVVLMQHELLFLYSKCQCGSLNCFLQLAGGSCRNRRERKVETSLLSLCIPKTNPQRLSNGENYPRHLRILCRTVLRGMELCRLFGLALESLPRCQWASGPA